MLMVENEEGLNMGQKARNKFYFSVTMGGK